MAGAPTPGQTFGAEAPPRSTPGGAQPDPLAFSSQEEGWTRPERMAASGAAPLPGGALREHLRRLELHERKQQRGGHSKWAVIGLPAAGFAIALGSLYWSASLRDQAVVQESSIAELRRQNQRLAEELKQATEDPEIADSASAATGTPRGGAAGDGFAGAGARQNGAGATGKGIAKGLAGAGAGGSGAVAEEYGRAGAAGRHGVATTGVATAGVAGAGAAGTGMAGTGVAGTGRLPAGRAGEPTPTSGLAEGSVPRTVATQPVYSDPLAENIAAVFNLQKNSPTKLAEFHLAEGSLAQPYPGLEVGVRSPDAKLGSYMLLVRSGPNRYEARGRVNSPLLLGTGPDGKQYELTVLNIAGNEIYGYVSKR